MKKVIFVCLLSLSMCLSQPSGTLDGTQTTIVPPGKGTTTIQPTEINPNNTTPSAGVTTTIVAPLPSGQNATHNVTEASNQPITNKPNDSKPTEKTNSTDVKPTEPTAAPADPAKDKDKNGTTTVVPANGNGTNPDNKDNKTSETTTPKGGNVSPTAGPVEAKSRAFDGPSFIGGIILTLGLLAIGFMGFKYYKNQTERNYHTL